MATRTTLLVLLVALAGCKAHGRANSDPITDTEAAEARELVKIAEAQIDRVPSDVQRRLARLCAEQKCPCADQGVLSECARAGTCVRARFAVRSILRGLARDEKEADIAARLLERFGPKEPEKLDLGSAPCRGAADAPVALVLFSDFECPWCALGRELVSILEKKAGKKLRVCFKHLPLTKIHEYAQLAAQAAVAAQLQGKFWEMHDRLFTHQKELSRDDLLAHAKAIGLELSRFTADLDGAAVVERIQRDGAEAERLHIRGTPTFLINGREMTDPKTVPDFLDWIDEAVALQKKGR